MQTNVNVLKLYAIGVLLLLLGIVTHSVSADESSDFVLNDLEGKEYRVSDYRGKWIVMNFWATWCPPCIHEMPELQAFHTEHKDTDAVVWGITFEEISKADLRKFLKKVNVTYPILGYGQNPDTGYGKVNVLPTTFLIDPAGKFFRRFEGPITQAHLEQAIASPP